MPLFGRKEKEKDDKLTRPSQPVTPFKTDKSFAPNDISKIKNELRILSVERDIAGEALTRLYEATVEGKISPEERDLLSVKYKDQVTKLESSLTHSEKVLSLNELEETRSELVNMFKEKFSELNSKIEEIRKGVGITPREIAPREVPELKLSVTHILDRPEKEEKAPFPEKPPVAPATPPTAVRKTKADDTLDKLRRDLQKELEKLEQIEMEG
ncbi:MAG: hypothetical protein ABIH76_01440 [Candidatus Bathyarchaeota archaeon]